SLFQFCSKRLAGVLLGVLSFPKGRYPQHVSTPLGRCPHASWLRSLPLPAFSVLKDLKSAIAQPNSIEIWGRRAEMQIYQRHALLELVDRAAARGSVPSEFYPYEP